MAARDHADSVKVKKASESSEKLIFLTICVIHNICDNLYKNISVLRIKLPVLLSY